MMSELNSAYEPPPLQKCQHNWMLIGCPVQTWSAAGTGGEPPDDAPTRQKRQCLICGGFEWITL